MTWIGKILIVFVLLLGLAWMWFTVNVFVARTNWKKDRDDWKRVYTEAEAARKTELDSYRADKDALERQLLAEQTRTKGYEDTIATLQGSNKKVADENIRLNNVIAKGDVTATEALAVLQALTDEQKKTRERNVLLETERVDLVVKKENAEKDKQAADNLARQANADKLIAESKVETLTTQLAEARQAGGNQNALVLNSFNKPPAPLPEGIRGTVTSYKDGYVALSIGIDAGLTNGATLDIYRTEGGGEYLGTVVIERVYPKEAVATFRPKDPRRTIQKLRAEELPKVGDTVGKVGASGPISLK